MRGHCKKCGWPWHKWGNNVSDFCEHCFKDPRTEFTPLVLFDIEGRPEGCGKNIAVQFKKGCDPDRTDRGIREWVSVEKRFVDGIGIDRGMPGKVRKDLEAWHSPGTNGWILVGVIDRQGDLQQAFKEDEFLEMFEPVRYERFWRQGEDYEPVLKPGHHARIYPRKVSEFERWAFPLVSQVWPTLSIKVEPLGASVRADKAKRERESCPSIDLKEAAQFSKGYFKKAAEDAKGLFDSEFDGVMCEQGFRLVLGSLRDLGERITQDYKNLVDNTITVEFIGSTPVKMYEASEPNETKSSRTVIMLVEAWEKHTKARREELKQITGKPRNGRIYSPEIFKQLLKPDGTGPDRAGMTMEELETMVETMTAGSIGWGKTETVAQLLSNLMKHIKTI